MNLINLAYHKNDFDLDACWTFSATGHGKGPCDGIGASVKATATRKALISGVLLSSAEQFFQFTLNFNRTASATDPPIHAFYISATKVENTFNTVLTNRWAVLDITGITLTIL